MSKTNKSLLMLIVILLANILMIVVYAVLVFAEPLENENRKLETDLSIEGVKIEHTSDERYYLNKPVEITLPDFSASPDNLNDIDQISQVVNELKSTYPEAEVGYYLNQYVSISRYDGEKFGDYEDMSDSKLTLEPGENDEYNRQILIFRTICSYKVYRCDGDEKIVENVIEVTYESPIMQFIFDKSAPAITGSNQGEAISNAVIGQQVSFNIKDASGLKLVEIIRNGNTLDNINLVGEERIVEYDYTLTLIKENQMGDDIKVLATDLAGNTSEYSFNYQIDNIAPEIQLLGLEDGRIYGGADLSIRVADDSGQGNIFFKCMYTNEEGESMCLENLTEGFTGNAALSRSYTAEGVYDVIAFAYDASGNYSETLRVSFGVDSNPPVISLENIIQDGVYNSNVDMHAVLKELFYSGASVEAECTVTNANGTYTVGLSPFQVGARVNKNIYSFYEEGVYEIKMNAIDGSGHTGSASARFTIDKSAPEIELSIMSPDNAGGDDNTADSIAGNITEMKAEMKTAGQNGEAKNIYSSCPMIRVRASDTYTEYETYINLIRKNGDNGYVLADSSKVISVGKNIDFTVPVDGEGEYILKLVMKDAAGNTAEKEVEFTVDENPPVIGYINNFNEKYIKLFSLPAAFEDYIEDMTKVSYRAFLNSEEISSCEISKDGRYILQIVAVDEAGNISEGSAAFIVDSTSPRVIVSGIDTEGNVKLNDTINLSLFDEDDYFESVTLNGKAVRVSEDRHTSSIDVNGYGNYEIVVSAKDFAGNETVQVIKTSCEYKASPFTVKIDASDIKKLTKNEPQIRENFLPENGNRKILIICMVAGLMAAATCIILFVDIKFLKCDTIKAGRKRD